jgi:two-component system OmpR family response regulator
MRHAGQVVTRTMLLEKRLGLSFRSADQCDRRPYVALRSKIDKGFQDQLLHTVRGAGYRLQA